MIRIVMCQDEFIDYTLSPDLLDMERIFLSAGGRIIALRPLFSFQSVTDHSSIDQNRFFSKRTLQKDTVSLTDIDKSDR